MSDNHEKFMARAIALSEKTSLVDSAGGVFGCVIVQDGEIIAEGANRVVAENDPTWHGEIEAIRNATVALNDVSLTFRDNEFVSILGPSGSGKTTLLNIIAGKNDPDEGRILFAKGARVGYLEQEAIEMGEAPVFEEVLSSQVEILEAEQRMKRLEAALGEDPAPEALAAAIEETREELTRFLRAEQVRQAEQGRITAALCLSGACLLILVLM